MKKKWAVHLFLNVPVLIEPPEQEIILFLLGGILIASLVQWNKQREIQRRKLEDPSLMPCPSCKKLIQKLSAICPFCQSSL